MAAAVFRTKFTAPTLPAHQQPRPRLDAFWDRDRCRLVTVTAGAGWGKTAFLAARAAALGDHALWYSLDELDRDPSVLAAHLQAACDLPPSSAPPLEQLAAIVGRLEERSLLILDDVHAIARADSAREFLVRLLRYLPPGCTLALAGREPVELAGARLDARGEAVHLTAADLAFTPDETAAVVAGRLGKAAAPLAPRIQDITDGWPTGLEICCQSLAEAAAADHTDVLARLESGEGRWFDRFSAEVVGELDPATRDFLLRASVLPYLESGLCDRLLDRRGSHRLLHRLAARGLFLSAVGDRTWRFHNLMRQCLRRHLSRELPAAARRRLHRRAADLLADRGEPEAAAHDLVRAGDPEGAIKLLARRAVELADTRRPETLSLVLADLPETDVRRSPAALLVRASQAQLRGQWDEAENDLRRAMRAKPTAAIAGALRARLIRLELQRGELNRCLATGRRALVGKPRPTGVDRGLILSSLGVAAASLGRMDQGEQYLDEALAVARRLDDQVLEGRCLYLRAANIHYTRGDLDQALRDAGHARDLYRELGRRDLACHAEGVLGFVLAGCGRLGEARESSRWALQRAEAIGYRLIASYTRLALGMCALLAADPAAALVRFGEAGDLARALGEQVLEVWAHLGLAEAAWQSGDHARACREAARAQELARAQGNPFCRARALAWQGRCAEQAQPGSGEAAWTEADRLFRRLGAALERDRLRLWRVAAGHEEPATVLADIAASGRGYLLDHLEAALAAELQPRAADPRSLSSAEPLRIRLLGPLEIDRGAAPLTEGAWRSGRARRLFNLLILSRSRSLPREQAMEAMWPEADPRKAAQSLRQSVFQLRRVLEPDQGGEPRHLLVEGDMLRLDLGTGGACDLDDFAAAVGDAQRARRDGDADAELDHLQAAVALWRGPVLADTPYDPEVDDACATLRHRFLRAAERLLDLLAARGRWDDAVALAQRALDEDPLHEPFARHLLRGLIALGHRVEARQAYARFEHRLVRELDLLPSDRLKELVERAAETKSD